MKYKFTKEDCKEAKQFLIDNNAWNHISAYPSTSDGFSIVTLANQLAHKLASLPQSNPEDQN